MADLAGVEVLLYGNRHCGSIFQLPQTLFDSSLLWQFLRRKPQSPAGICGAPMTR
jgi:hypothetical protein